MYETERKVSLNHCNVYVDECRNILSVLTYIIFASCRLFLISSSHNEVKRIILFNIIIVVVTR